MGNTSLKAILVNFATFGMLVFAIMTFIIIAQIDANLDPEYRLTNDTVINDAYGDLESNLDSQKKAQNSLDSFDKDPPQEYVGDLSVASIVPGYRTAKAYTIGLWNILIVLPTSILATDTKTVIAGLTVVFLTLVVIGGWALYKGSVD